MKCRICRGTMTDLTRGKGAGRNYACNCGAHAYHKMISFHENKYESQLTWFTKIEWKAFVEGVI